MSTVTVQEHKAGGRTTVIIERQHGSFPAAHLFTQTTTVDGRVRCAGEILIFTSNALTADELQQIALCAREYE